LELSQPLAFINTQLDILFQKIISALTLIKLLLRMRHATPPEIPLGTPLPLLELPSQRMPWLPHIQVTPSTFSLDLRVTLSQRKTFALTLTRQLLRMRPATLPETPHGTLSPPPEPLSQRMLWPLPIQHTPSISNSVPMLLLLQRLTTALTPTKPLLKMRHAPPPETPPGTPSPPQELLSQLMLKLPHTQLSPSTD
jgi:hypothetical protein